MTEVGRSANWFLTPLAADDVFHILIQRLHSVDNLVGFGGKFSPVFQHLGGCWVKVETLQYVWQLVNGYGSTGYYGHCTTSCLIIRTCFSDQPSDKALGKQMYKSGRRRDKIIVGNRVAVAAR
ncbi:MAG TPA: hypothetical protein VIO35_00630 [Chloroflexota bacterium]